MPQAFIKLVYRQVIDAQSEEPFAKMILSLSFEEFRLKCQAYNPEGRFKTFTALKANDGRANSLHYKSGFAVAGLIESLDKKMPGITDNLDTPIRFTNYKFEVIESDIFDISAHKVAIHYFTDVCTLYGVIGEHLLLGYGDTMPEEIDDFKETFLLKIQGGLSVLNYREALSFTIGRKIPDVSATAIVE